MSRTQTDRHIIWSDMSLDPDYWKDGYKKFLEINELDDDPKNYDEKGILTNPKNRNKSFER